MDGKELLDRVVKTIQEMYLKIGQPVGSTSLYYPYSGDLERIESEFRKASDGFLDDAVLETLPERLRITISEKDSRRIASLDAPQTMKDVIQLCNECPDPTDFIGRISERYPDSVVQRSGAIDFDWVLVFPKDLDNDVYCLSEELGRVTYHRFSEEEYLAFGFVLPDRK